MKSAKQNPELADTLARRVSQLREMQNLSCLDLSKLSRLELKRIEAIESGQEIWLSITDRSRLARALGVQASVLRELESCPSDLPCSNEQRWLGDIDELAERILLGEVNIACPKCGVCMKTSIENALDFEGNPTQFARAYCPSCPFGLR